MKIVADQNIPFLKGILEPFTDVEYIPGNQIRKKDVIDADALIIRTRTKCNASLLEGTNVKFIATATIGYDHIDTAWCEKNGITWTNAAGCNAGSVYQYVASSLVVLSERFGYNFRDRSLGIIGVGNVGRKIVKLGEWLGMRVIMCDPPKARIEGTCGYISLEGIIRESDIITCHVPLNMNGPDQTYHLINERILQKLNPDTILINTSRGEVVDNQALKQELKTRKKIQAAVLDVWENEPGIDKELVDLIDIASPHIAGYAADGKANATTMTIHSFSKFFNLPLTRWIPEHIPTPSATLLTINCHGKREQEILSEAIKFSYNVLEDDRRLRNSGIDFENQRSTYPLRREFNTFTIHLENQNQDIVKRLKGLGFKVITNDANTLTV